MNQSQIKALPRYGNWHNHWGGVNVFGRKSDGDFVRLADVLWLAGDLESEIARLKAEIKQQKEEA